MLSENLGQKVESPRIKMDQKDLEGKLKSIVPPIRFAKVKEWLY